MLNGFTPIVVLQETVSKEWCRRCCGEDANNVAASAGILAGLALEKDFINQVLSREIVEQSVIYMGFVLLES